MSIFNFFYLVFAVLNVWNITCFKSQKILLELPNLLSIKENLSVNYISNYMFGYFDELKYFTLFTLNEWTVLAFGIDSISAILLLLILLIIPLSILYCWNNITNKHAAAVYLYILEILLIVAFVTRDLLIFFIVFEVLLWPMYRLIIIWGAHEQKKRAAMSFVLYTVFGSLILLITIIILLLTFSTTSIDIFLSYKEYFTFFNFNHTSNIENHSQTNSIWWIAFFWVPAFIAFAVKIPTFPFHHWLTLAHVEAPTAGSIILAALLLKLGSYGFLRFIFPIFNVILNYIYFMPLIFSMCLLSIIFAAIMAISQSDLKRIIAYSSIAHMNFSLLGIFAFSDRAVIGGIILFIAHGFISAALFFLVGMLYDRYHQRDLLYFRGLSTVMPLYSIVYFLTNLANLGIPLSFNFVGEFLIYIELINLYWVISPLIVFALIIQIGYTMKLLSILFGNVIIFNNLIKNKIQWVDLTIVEIFIVIILVVSTYYLGIFGNTFISLISNNYYFN